jgi:hypothetical protein
MKRLNLVLALSFIALTLASAAGCVTATDEDPAEHAEEALSTDISPSDEPTFEITRLDDGGFRFVSVAAVGLPAGALWAKLSNMAQVVSIVLPGVASDFQWVDGGCPGKVPSRFQFSVNGVLLLEEIFYRNHDDKVLQYRLVTPALGIESYVGTLELDEVDAEVTVITFSREMRFADPASADALIGLLQAEMVNLQAYFARGPS